MDIVSASITLFLIMDPIGNLPVFLSLLRDETPRQRFWITVRELAFAYGVLVGFLFLGQAFMDLFDLKQQSISVAAGIVLFIIAIRMIFPPERGGIMGETPKGGVFFVPLAVPLIAGPSTLATLMLMVRRDPARLPEWLAALTIAWLGTTVLLLCGGLVYRVLRDRGLVALERLMGMILVAIAVQMVLDGAANFIASVN